MAHKKGDTVIVNWRREGASSFPDVQRWCFDVGGAQTSHVKPHEVLMVRAWQAGKEEMQRPRGPQEFGVGFRGCQKLAQCLPGSPVSPSFCVEETLTHLLLTDKKVCQTCGHLFPSLLLQK